MSALPNIIRYLRDIIVIVLLMAAGGTVQAQLGEPGFLLSIGAGSGYSSHASHYKVFEQFKVKEYSGFRIFVIELKAGWRFTEHTAVYATGQVSPGNSIISSYRYYTAGLGITQGLVFVPKLFVKAGAMYNTAGVEPGKSVGSGVLVNLGLGIPMGDRGRVEMNFNFGGMDEDNYLDPNPFPDSEFQFNILLSYAIF